MSRELLGSFLWCDGFFPWALSIPPRWGGAPGTQGLWGRQAAVALLGDPALPTMLLECRGCGWRERGCPSVGSGRLPGLGQHS